eukprot:TRINITY_DN2025_c0_g1_i3.p2 TRINITY_DN2025_c0_g1~~TRINITY_DN2025_c0_g1_i3.p2  ORF type:complete len:154 (-),score=40.85 TRINITY_DN2025_c0_g1_i3:35-496(-)
MPCGNICPSKSSVLTKLLFALKKSLTKNSDGTFDGYFRCNYCLARNYLQLEPKLFLRSETEKDMQDKLKKLNEHEVVQVEEDKPSNSKKRRSFFHTLTSMIGPKTIVATPFQHRRVDSESIVGPDSAVGSGAGGSNGGSQGASLALSHHDSSS